MQQAVKEPPDLIFCTDAYEQDDLSTTDSHWRHVLKHMLQLPGVRESGGIGSSINEALTHGPRGNNRESKKANVPMDTAEPKVLREYLCLLVHLPLWLTFQILSSYIIRLFSLLPGQT